MESEDRDLILHRIRQILVEVGERVGISRQSVVLTSQSVLVISFASSDGAMIEGQNLHPLPADGIA